jgi:DNA-binding NtrC family response regulator
MEAQAPRLVVLDMNFSRSTSGEEGLDFLKELQRNYPGIPVILITAWSSVDLAVAGMKAGAHDFLPKPWSNDRLLHAVQTALKLREGHQAKGRDRKALESAYDFSGMIGDSPQFLRILETIWKIADTHASVLITGESGTGKELVAEAIHRNSSRKAHPFVKVNLGGIPQELFESELFGYKKGAFTGAETDRQGRFSAANKGTIFLDEIGELALNNQVKLLRVLQEQEFEPLGESRTQKVDVRVIAATNRNLTDMIARGAFREDLYYRLNLITIEVPPLRERKSDIPALVRHFLQVLRKVYQKPGLGISAEALKYLQALPWPGNIRELKNLVERTVLVSNQEILQKADFLQSGETPQNEQQHESYPAGMTLEAMEEQHIRKALEVYRGNISEVARALGISRGALYRRLQKYGIETDASS